MRLHNNDDRFSFDRSHGAAIRLNRAIRIGMDEPIKSLEQPLGVIRSLFPQAQVTHEDGRVILDAGAGDDVIDIHRGADGGGGEDDLDGGPGDDTILP